MSGGLGIAAVAGLILGLLTAMAFLRAEARRREWSAEVQRKLVHVGAGGLAMALPWILADDWQVYLLLALTFVAMLALRTRALAGLGETLHGVERRSWGDFFLVAAVALVFLFAEDRAILYVLPLAVLTFSDAAAALTGTAYGRHFYETEDGRKSIEGSVMFFLLTMLIAMICLLLLSETPRGSVILLAAAIATFTTLVEADSWHGFDNLFLPMGVQIFLIATLDVPVADAALRMAFLVASLAVVYALSRHLGLSARLGRVHGLAFFMLLSVTAIQNAVLPALMLIAQIAGTRRNPEGRTAEALSVVGALALLSFGFLAAGAATGLNAVNFFGLATGAIAAAYVPLVLRDLKPAVRVGAALLGAVVIFALWTWIVGLNGMERRWHPPVSAAAAVILTGAALIPALWTDTFRTAGNLRVAVLGAAPVVLLYAALSLWETLP